MPLTHLATGAAAGALTGALAVRPLAFHYTAPTHHPLPRRTCPHCDHPLNPTRPHDLRAISLTRRCPHCTTRIGPAPLLPEALAAVGFAAVLQGGGGPWVTAAQLWLVTIGAALVITDASARRLPDHLTAAAGAGIVLFLGAAAVCGADGSPIRAAEAAAVTSAVFFALLLVGSLGMGDLKIAPPLAAILGWHSWTALFWGLAASFTLGAAHAVVVLVSGARQRWIAFGPALIIGTLAASIPLP